MSTNSYLLFKHNLIKQLILTLPLYYCQCYFILIRHSVCLCHLPTILWMLKKISLVWIIKVCLLFLFSGGFLVLLQFCLHLKIHAPPQLKAVVHIKAKKDCQTISSSPTKASVIFVRIGLLFHPGSRDLYIFCNCIILVPFTYAEWIEVWTKN